MSKGWHIAQDGGVWTLCRRMPARFDLIAETVLLPVHPVRLMHQIRQDIWRALQRLRGFAPAVRLTPDAAGWRVAAGGQAPVFAPVHLERLRAVLERPANRSRWARYAGHWSEPAAKSAAALGGGTNDLGEDLR